MKNRHLPAVLLALVGASAVLPAQAITIPRARRGLITMAGDANRPRLGISIESTGASDTLGVLVADVSAGSPADKAGIKAGDRLVAVNGVNLRLAPADAQDEEMQGIGARRLTRELARHEPGDEVEVRLMRDGRAQAVKVKTARAAELESARSSWASSGRGSGTRASLGIGLGATGSKRDTLGVLVASLASDGPAEKAGLEEGDRIAAVNGVDLRVQREDIGDWNASTARVNRLYRELEKLTPGDEVELRIYRAGQPRTVKVKTVAARELQRTRRAMFMTGDAPFGAFRFEDAPVPPVPPVPPAAGVAPVPPRPPVAPRVIWFDDDGDGGVRLRISPRVQDEVREMTRQALEEARARAMEVAPRRHQRIRVELEGDRTPGDVPSRAPRRAASMVRIAAPPTT